MHALDAEIVERGDQLMTAAWCFGIFLKTIPNRRASEGTRDNSPSVLIGLIGSDRPGHTPGSIAVYLGAGDKRVLFGQEISAPLLERFQMRSHCCGIKWR